MNNNHIADTGVLAIDIGNTKVNGQVRDAHYQLIDEWKTPTKQYDSLLDVIEQGFARAKKALRDKPDVVGLGFGGPVDSQTGAVKLAFVPEFQEITQETAKSILEGVPVVHLNDVEAAAHILVSPYFEPTCTSLSPEPILKPGPSMLIEIGTGVGTACALSGGSILPSEAHWAPAKDSVPHGHRLSGDYGFPRLIEVLQQRGTKLPSVLSESLSKEQTLGPLITEMIAQNDTSDFAQAALDLYAAWLGEYCGMLQLCFLATGIYIGGSVGRAPGFLEKVVSNDNFWKAFAEEGAFRGKDMPIFRIDDTDSTVRGIYTAAMKYLANSKAASV
jgi:glucokinase